MLGVAVGKLRGTGGSCRYRIDGDDCVTGHEYCMGRWEMAPEEEMECNVAYDELGLRSGGRGVLAGASQTLQADLVSSLDSSMLGARDWWCGCGARCSRGSATGPQG